MLPSSWLRLTWGKRVLSVSAAFGLWGPEFLAALRRWEEWYRDRFASPVFPFFVLLGGPRRHRG
eukprot:457813-Pyramimonas_sp.AAC.1